MTTADIDRRTAGRVVDTSGTGHRRLVARDFINVGLFTALYFAVVWATTMLGMVAPWMRFVGWGIGILLNGIVVALFVARTPKIGALTSLGTIMGIFMVLTGHFWATIAFTAALGLIADVIVSRGAAETIGRRVPWAYAVFTMWLVAPMVPIIINSEAYFAEMSGRLDPATIEGMRVWFQPWILCIWAFVVFGLGYLGGRFGVKLNVRHFNRAGLA